MKQWMRYYRPHTGTETIEPGHFEHVTLHDMAQILSNSGSLRNINATNDKQKNKSKNKSKMLTKIRSPNRHKHKNTDEENEMPPRGIKTVLKGHKSSSKLSTIKENLHLMVAPDAIPARHVRTNSVSINSPTGEMALNVTLDTHHDLSDSNDAKDTNFGVVDATLSPPDIDAAETKAQTEQPQPENENNNTKQTEKETEMENGDVKVNIEHQHDARNDDSVSDSSKDDIGNEIANQAQYLTR